jgi:hypothetical protein
MKTMNLAMVAMLAMGTALTTLGKTKSAYASLTAPASYDYSYTWNATDNEQYLNANGFDTIPLYDRTADGLYYNYTSTFQVVDGLEVTMLFNRSNTDWQASGTKYKPDEDKIGSDGTVGVTSNKLYFKWDNQTYNDYSLYLDLSSTTTTYQGWTALINGSYYITNRTNNLLEIGNHGVFTQFYITAYSYFEFSTRSDSSAALQYFDAWYLQNLGISESYQQGYDANRVGILTDYLGTDAQQIGWVLLGIAAIIFVFKGGK